MPAPGMPYDWSIETDYFSTYVNHLPPHVEHVRTSYIAPSDILAKEKVFQDVGGGVGVWRYLKRCL